MGQSKSAAWIKMASVPTDRLIQRFTKGRGFDFEPPARIVLIKPVGDDALFYLECPKRLRAISSTDVHAHLKGGLSGGYLIHRIPAI